MPGRSDPKTGSKWTRMWIDQDLANLNVRREQLAHLVHYKHAIHTMKQLSKKLGRPIRVADLGSGESNWLRMFYSADASKKSDVIESYTGLEGDASCVRRTQEKAATVLRGCNGTVEEWDLSRGKLPFEKRSIDLIICNEVLEHLPYGTVPALLKASRKALARNGVAVFSTPNKDGTNERLPADHNYEYGYTELNLMFDEAGWVIDDYIGVYIKKNNLVSWLRDNNEPDMLEHAERCWSAFGNDFGSIMTADMAVPVANNIIRVCRRKRKDENAGTDADV